MALLLLIARPIVANAQSSDTQIVDELIVASIDNLLDNTNFETIGFPAMGRRARLALDWRF